MRPSRLTVVMLASTVFALSAASILFACGSSSNGEGANDSGTTPTSPDAMADGSADGGGSGNGNSDGGPGTDAASSSDGSACNIPSAVGFTTAAHGPAPDMVYSGGGILTAPKMVTFTFNDTFEPSTLAAFGQTITQTPWFAAVSKDYCVDDGGTCIQGGSTGEAHALDAGSSFVWVDNAFNPPGSGLSDAGVDFIGYMFDEVAKITPGGLESVDPNTIFTFYFAPGATFYMGDPNIGGQPGCGFGGYHNAVATLADGGGVPLTYAIIVDCGQGSPADQELAGLTVAASHELIEATTDPYNGTGWYLDQDQNELDAGLPTTNQLRNQAWADTDQFGEIGDNCESLINPEWILDSGVPVQRIWSTSAAAAGQNPCVPVPAGETYYNTNPDEAIYVVDAGGSFTIDVTGFSPTARAGWQVQAVDQTPSQLPDGGQSSPLLSMQFVGGTAGTVAPGGTEIPCMNNGTTAQLKVTLLGDPAADPALNNPFVQPIWQQAEGAIVSLDTTATPLTFAGSTYYPYQLWPFAVVTPEIAAQIGVTGVGVPESRHAGVGHARHPRTWERSRGKLRPVSSAK